ncbi:MAG: helix-turn-helix transcriptional regulator [Lachnospiraceae bacterium]|nr:helix-turn-helix transcriptional regulator [Lachnospiraceae bacterium]
MIGEQIKALRIARNMSQVELAAALNVSKQSVSNWENNNILPSVEIIKQLALFFSCSSDYLLELDDSTKSYIDISDLNLEQAAHITAIANDMKILNKKIKGL